MTVCSVCGATRRRVLYPVRRWQVVRCGVCGHRELDPHPAPAEVAALYDATYYANPAFATTDHHAYFGYADYIRDRAHIQTRLARVLDRIASRVPRGRLLDVGCGLGFFVEVALEAGWDAWGVDANADAVGWATAHVTDRVLEAPAGALPFPDGHFDCVVMFDVIEHLLDPATDLGEAWRVLRPGGLLVVATPDAGSLPARLLRSRWLEVQRAPEHIHFFDIGSLSVLLARAGFTPLEWHSMGKITTLRTVLADLRFYAPRLFGWVEAFCGRRGWLDRVVEIDPRTKLCVYARRAEHRPVAVTRPVRAAVPRRLLRLAG